MASSPAYRLLVVDDNELNLGLFRLSLTQLGHQVRAVTDPLIAIELAGEQHFDLIFTDIQMPGIDGIETAKRLRQQGFAGPIIAITAHLSNSEAQQLEDAPIDEWLIKPVSKFEVGRLLNARLGSEVREDPPPDFTVQSTEPEDNEGRVYDIELALERANQSKRLAMEIQTLLLENLKESLPGLRADIPAEELSQSLHKMLGGVRFSGAAKLEWELEHARQALQYEGETDLADLHAVIQEVIDWTELHPDPFETA